MDARRLETELAQLLPGVPVSVTVEQVPQYVFTVAGKRVSNFGLDVQRAAELDAANPAYSSITIRAIAAHLQGASRR